MREVRSLPHDSPQVEVTKSKGVTMTAPMIAAALIIGGCAVLTIVFGEPYPPLAAIVLIQLIIVCLDEYVRCVRGSGNK